MRAWSFQRLSRLFGRKDAWPGWTLLWHSRRGLRSRRSWPGRRVHAIPRCARHRVDATTSSRTVSVFIYHTRSRYSETCASAKGIKDGRPPRRHEETKEHEGIQNSFFSFFVFLRLFVPSW